jgi:hypothetical protein
MEIMSTATRRDRIDLCIFYPLLYVDTAVLNKRNRRNAVGFATGSPRPYPGIWIGDQKIGLWINAPAPRLTRVKSHFISDYARVKPHFHFPRTILISLQKKRLLIFRTAVLVSGAVISQNTHR